MKRKIWNFRFNLAKRILPGEHTHIAAYENWRDCPKCK